MADGLDEDEHAVTMSEYYEGIEAQELEADLVLGGDEGKECTYCKGYMARQAVFSCLTCTPEGNAGVCTACSMHCHDGHEVVELWTRRHFRCDCGNSKFGVGVCRLYSSKDVENDENTYNHNYKGVYCTCKRPYPDPDGEDQGEMLQCCICEDWFHENHLGLESAELVPRDEEGEPVFDELVCQACAGRLQFFSVYKELLLPLQVAVGSVIKPAEELSSIGDKHITVQEPAFVISEEAATETKASVPSEVLDVETGYHISFQASSGFSDNATELQKSKLEHKPGDSTHHVQTEITHCKLKQVKCRIAELLCENNSGLGDVGIELCGVQVKNKKVLFLSKNWRTQLCRCNECLHMYSVKGVGFLLDSEDTLQKYEEVAQQKRKEKMEAAEGDGLAMLRGLGHVEQIEFLHKLNDMTSELSSFFALFQESGRTVTRTDVQDFFENLNRKRKRLE